jgi:hypothetical protein
MDKIEENITCSQDEHICYYEREKEKIRIVQDKLYNMIVNLDSKTDTMQSSLEDFNNFLNFQREKDRLQDDQLNEIKSVIQEAISTFTVNESFSEKNMKEWKNDLLNKVEEKLQFMKMSIDSEIANSIGNKVVDMQQKNIEHLLGIESKKVDSKSNNWSNFWKVLLAITSAGGLIFIIVEKLVSK